ncbi:hypothetical protein RND81_05G002400 [Saponaria officinalis]|uniref:Uncharacterized protein n=1 Tax=Saponaria officinalis TaxID=3572 RepID=A0AAW1KRQ2_SAPOF
MASGRAKRREVYGTENSWCRAVPGGTGVTVLCLLLKTAPDISALQTALHTVQKDHPILRSKLQLHPTPSFRIPPSSSLVIQSYDLDSTAQIIGLGSGPPFQIILEHQMNLNPWTETESDVMEASAYEIGEGRWTVVIKLHTAACDRTSALQVMRELLININSNSNSSSSSSNKSDEERLSLGIEEYVPTSLGSKPFWARGIDMLGYSLNSFRFSNLPFVHPASQRSSRVARLFLDSRHTSLLLQGCKTRGIKLCGALSAAGLIAARLSKGLSNGEWEKYAVVTLIDCRKLLQPPLSNHHVDIEEL